MAYTAVPTITTGDIATAAWGNTYIKDNFAAGVPDIITADSEVIIGTGANAVEVVAILDSSNRLKHEYGGLEFNASGVTTGDTIVGQSSGVMGLETAMTQGQAQAGTDTQVRGVTALRLKEAISALGVANPMTANLDLAANLLVGNGGSTGIAISAAGEVSMAAQPAFAALNSSDDNNVTGNGTVATVDYDTEIFDQNADFASDTFTAPITGRYRLGASVLLNGLTTGSTDIRVRFTTSNRLWTVRPFMGLPDGVGTSLSTPISALVDMDATDTVTVTVVVVGMADTVDILEGATDPNTWFTGNLVA